MNYPNEQQIPIAVQHKTTQWGEVAPVSIPLYGVVKGLIRETKLYCQKPLKNVKRCQHRFSAELPWGDN